MEPDLSLPRVHSGHHHHYADLTTLRCKANPTVFDKIALRDKHQPSVCGLWINAISFFNRRWSRSAVLIRCDTCTSPWSLQIDIHIVRLNLRFSNVLMFLIFLDHTLPIPPALSFFLSFFANHSYYFPVNNIVIVIDYVIRRHLLLMQGSIKRKKKGVNLSYHKSGLFVVLFTPKWQANGLRGHHELSTFQTFWLYLACFFSFSFVSRLVSACHKQLARPKQVAAFN